MDSLAGFTSLEHAREWFRRRRWFGDKGRHVTDLRSVFAAEVDIGDSPLRLEVIELGFASGESSRYMLLRDPGRVESDRIEDASVRAWLMTGFANDRVVTGSTGELRWSTTSQLAKPANEIAQSSRVFRGEQSNSSIVYGDEVMVKLFRKLQRGQNPEVEIGAHLTANTDFAAFPRLIGTITFVSDGEATTIAAVQEFVASHGDAWSWLLDEISDPAFATEVVKETRKLGQRTAQMHTALASGKAAAFAPDLATAGYARAVHEEALRELHDTQALLAAHGVPDIGDLGQSLGHVLQDLRELDGTNLIRIHGDYHLGQVLRTLDDDFAILDFEGEPSRPLHERRAKASPLRDVAGMLRSFDYAAESARRRYRDSSPEGFTAWGAAAREAFGEGYTTTVSGSSSLSQGLSPERRQRLVAAFEIHKALYEVRYELGNRPDWLDIPLDGLRRLASPRK